jgi:hypothetical protein
LRLLNETLTERGIARANKAETMPRPLQRWLLAEHEIHDIDGMAFSAYAVAGTEATGQCMPIRTGMVAETVPPAPATE